MPAKHWPLPWVRSYSLRGRIWAATRRIVPCASGGFRTDIQGVAMQRSNDPGYHVPGAYIIDDWR